MTSGEWLERNSWLRLQNESAMLNCDIALPCPEADIVHLVDRARKELNCELPKDYLNFLRLADGLVCNGGTIYGSRSRTIDLPPDTFGPASATRQCNFEGIIERTKELRTRGGSHAQSVVFGDSDLDYFEWQPSIGCYGFVGKGTGEFSATFKSFEEMARQRIPPVVLQLVAFSV